MLDIRDWLNTTGIAFENTVWKKTPEYPYGVFLDESDTRGADEKLFIKEHDLNIEIYSDTQKGITCAEESIDRFLCSRGVGYTHLEREWDDQENHFQSSYHFSLTEKLED